MKYFETRFIAPFESYYTGHQIVYEALYGEKHRRQGERQHIYRADVVGEQAVFTVRSEKPQGRCDWQEHMLPGSLDTVHMVVACALQRHIASPDTFVSLQSLKQMHAWFNDRIETLGFSVRKLDLEDSETLRLAQADASNPWQKTKHKKRDARKTRFEIQHLNLEVQVIDEQVFYKSFTRGIGRFRGFGMGTLILNDKGK